MKKRFREFWGLVLGQFPFWHVMAVGLIMVIGCGCIRYEPSTPAEDSDWSGPDARGEQVWPDERPRFEPRPREERRPWGAPAGEAQTPLDTPQQEATEVTENSAPQPLPPSVTSVASCKNLPDISRKIERQPADPTGGSANAGSFEPQRHEEHQGFSGAKIIAGSDSADRLIADIRARNAGWTLGNGEQCQFQVVQSYVGAEGASPGALVVYYRNGQVIGEVERYGGAAIELDAILGKHPLYRGNVRQSPQTVGAWFGGAAVPQPRQPVCVWNGAYWECH